MKHHQRLRSAIEHERELAEVGRSHVRSSGNSPGLSMRTKRDLAKLASNAARTSCFGGARARPHEDRRQDAARYRQQMRYKQDGNFASERRADLLLHLRRMAMVADLVGAEVLVHFGEKLFDRSLTTRTSGAGLGVDQDRVTGSIRSRRINGRMPSNDPVG